MKSKKIVFFDVDHTLYDPNTRSIPESSIDAIRKLHARGDTIIAIATGRAPYMLGIIREIEAYVSLYVTVNGQIILRDGNIVHDDPMQPEFIKQTKQLFIDNNLHYGFIGKQAQAISKLDPYAKKMFEDQNLPYPVEDPDFEKNHDVYQMWAFADETRTKNLRKQFEHIQLVPWLSDGFDIIEGDKSKKDGVLKALELTGIALEDAYCFGDGENDKEMLEALPNSFAMGNASDSIKAVATYTTRSYDKGGIAHALKWIGLID